MIFHSNILLVVLSSVFLVIYPQNFQQDTNRASSLHLRPQITEDPCCLIPTCSDASHCYETTSCGYLCTTGEFPLVRDQQYHTPGYNRKRYFLQNDCHFGVCQDFKIMCNHCPDPRNPNFNIHTVRRDCIECYFK